MLTIDRRAFIRLSAAGLALSVLQPALAAEPGAQLFSFVSQAESIVAALTKEDAGSLRDAAAVAKALRERGGYYGLALCGAQGDGRRAGAGAPF
jgi:hypothetical protein